MSDTYYKKNKERLLKKHTCTICNNEYTKSNYSNHKLSSIHRIFIYINSITKILD